MRRRAAARGYTAVELMMSIALLGVGISGVIAMQKITVSTNKYSRTLAVATQVAQAWLDELTADATLWNHPSGPGTASDLGETQWLQYVGQGWSRPPDPANFVTRPFAAAFDALGNPTQDPNVAQFCTHIRLSWLVPEGQGNGLIRTEVRVFWVREGAGGLVDARPLCDPGIVPDAIAAAYSKYHFVYLTSAVRQNPPVR